MCVCPFMECHWVKGCVVFNASRESVAECHGRDHGGRFFKSVPLVPIIGCGYDIQVCCNSSLDVFSEQRLWSLSLWQH